MASGARASASEHDAGWERNVDAAAMEQQVASAPMPDWVDVTRRNSRAVQSTVGWIFWDPAAVSRYEALGLPGPLGYIAARCAPLAPAGAEAVVAAFGSISPAAIHATFAQRPDFDAFWRARDTAVVDGLRRFAPAIVAPLQALAPGLWSVVESLPKVGRPFFAGHLRMRRPADPLLSGWHAVNCIREWRGDTHWALVAAARLTGIEASILHNAWLGYERDWIPRSRGSDLEEITDGWTSLRERALADDRGVTDRGVRLRQRIEDETDALTSIVWQRLGLEASLAFADRFEGPCELLLARVDVTAGPNYQPASRVRTTPASVMERGD